MPIIVETKKKGSLVSVLLIALIVVLMGIATYFVFFSEAPIIDNFSSTEFKRATQIQAINFDTATIFNSPVRKLLLTRISLPPTGTFGRENPFTPAAGTSPSDAATAPATTDATTTTTTTTTTTSPATTAPPRP